MPRRVFLVQRPSYFSKERKGWVNKYDFSGAKEHGELVIMLQPGNIFGSRFNKSVSAMKEALADYNPKEDSILATGDPVAIAVAVIIAGQKGAVNLLRYDRRDNSYKQYKVNVNDDQKTAD